MRARGSAAALPLGGREGGAWPGRVRRMRGAAELWRPRAQVRGGPARPSSARREAAALGPRDCAVPVAPRPVEGRWLGTGNRVARPACAGFPRAAGVWRVWAREAVGWDQRERRPGTTVWAPGSKGGTRRRSCPPSPVGLLWPGDEQEVFSRPCLGGVALLVCLFSLVVVVFCLFL